MGKNTLNILSDNFTRVLFEFDVDTPYCYFAFWSGFGGFTYWDDGWEKGNASDCNELIAYLIRGVS